MLAHHGDWRLMMPFATVVLLWQCQGSSIYMSYVVLPPCPSRSPELGGLAMWGVAAAAAVRLSQAPLWRATCCW